jgi:hypothetical protein
MSDEFEKIHENIFKEPKIKAEDQINNPDKYRDLGRLLSVEEGFSPEDVAAAGEAFARSIGVQGGMRMVLEPTQSTTTPGSIDQLPLDVWVEPMNDKIKADDLDAFIQRLKSKLPTNEKLKYNKEPKLRDPE